MTTDEQLAAHPRWRWLPGMRTATDATGRAWRVRDHGGRPEPMLERGPRLRQRATPLSECLPDLGDLATAGSLLGLLGPGWKAINVAEGHWVVCTVDGAGPSRCGPLGEAAGKAVIAHWDRLDAAA